MNDDVVIARLKETCAYLPGPRGSIGSGYLVARGRVGTANHVVKDWLDETWYEVTIGWGPPRAARARVVGRDRAADAAVLEVSGCDDIAPLSITGLPPASAIWHGFGFPKAAHDGETAVGLPIQGTVDDPRWTNGRQTHQILLFAREAAAGAATPLHGFSGSPVVVRGALIGHVVEQFGDVDDRNRPAFGKIKACPIAAVARLLDVAPRFDMLVTGGRTSQDKSGDPDIAELASWCDREAVVALMHRWIDRGDVANAGILCLVGHSDNRPRLLLDRIAAELAEPPREIAARAIHILKDHDVGSEDGIRRAALAALGVLQDADVPRIKEYQDGARLVLLCHYSDGEKWSGREVSQLFRNAAKWLAGLSPHLGSLRLVLVLTMRHGTPSMLERLLGRHGGNYDAVAQAFRREAGSSAAALHSWALGEPMKLGDYSIEHVRNWREMKIVRESLGRAASDLDDTVVGEWFRHSTCSHGDFVRLLNAFYREKVTANRSNA